MSSNYFTADQEAWLRQKLGRMSSSEVWKIFKGGKRDMTPEELADEKARKGRRTTVDTMFGDGAITYIRGKVTELKTQEIKEDVDYKQTEWGKANEGDGVREFTYATGLTVIYNGISCPKFYPYGDFFGGSPDGKIIEEDAGIEMKCPYDSAIHTKRRLINSLAEFKEQYWEDYCQCQSNMHIMKTDFWYYASYDPRRKERKERIKIFKMEPDLMWISEFEERLMAAIELMGDILKADEQSKTVTE